MVVDERTTMDDPTSLTPSDGDLESTALLVLADGPMAASELARRMRRRLVARCIDGRLVEMLVERSPLLVGLPDGSVIRLIDLLEGSVFTERVAHSDGQRRDLWTSLALAPLMAWLDCEGLCLTSGEPLARGEFGHDTILGPTGWLPAVPAGSLVSLTVTGGRIAVAAVDDRALLTSEPEGAVRRALSRHYRTATWWTERRSCREALRADDCRDHRPRRGPETAERAGQAARRAALPHRPTVRAGPPPARRRGLGGG